MIGLHSGPLMLCCAVDAQEELRRVCGGHGFHMYSGMQDLYGNSMVNFTGQPRDSNSRSPDPARAAC